MVITVNYWVVMSPAMAIEMRKVLPVVFDHNPREDEPVISTQSFLFPLINSTKESTRDLLKRFPGRYGQQFAPGLWNCYFQATGLFQLVPMREDLQELVAAYPGDIQVGGCWDVATGQPVGGVGSPWFVTPPDLVDWLPPKPVDPVIPNTTFPPTEVGTEANVLWDVTLLAGQAPRVFV
jgi:hypothetical protein